MPKLLNIVGKKFGKLIVIKRDTKTKKRTYWFCLCDCGKIKSIRQDGLINGSVLSCGCYNKNKLRTINGLSKRKIYKCWNHIISRCYNIKDCAFNNYGGRGIIMCNEWKNNFINFYNWAIKNGYEDGLTIDRINNNGNYCPENCRWISDFEQGHNKRNNIWITYKGKRLWVAEWCRVFGKKQSEFCKKKKMGFTNKEILDMWSI